eukprot:766889-Hanusia_phi.AAC.3
MELEERVRSDEQMSEDELTTVRFDNPDISQSFLQYSVRHRTWDDPIETQESFLLYLLVSSLPSPSSLLYPSLTLCCFSCLLSYNFLDCPSLFPPSLPTLSPSLPPPAQQPHAFLYSSSPMTSTISSRLWTPR